MNRFSVKGREEKQEFLGEIFYDTHRCKIKQKQNTKKPFPI